MGHRRRAANAGTNERPLTRPNLRFFELPPAPTGPARHDCKALGQRPKIMSQGLIAFLPEERAAAFGPSSVKWLASAILAARIRERAKLDPIVIDLPPA